MILRKWLQYFYYVTVRASRNAAGENKKKRSKVLYSDRFRARITALFLILYQAPEVKFSPITRTF